MLASITDVSNNNFDYIIVGGGTAGLTLAARLSEDPTVSVAVLEAGEPNLDDPKIMIPGQYAHTFTNPKYDWTFMTTPQEHSNNTVDLWSRGKGLGGSSAMNFFCWIKPPAHDIDVIERLGNPGWNWKNYMKYSQLVEKFHVASEEHSAVYPHTFNAEFRGTKGRIDTSTPHHVHEIDLLIQQSFVNRGLKAVTDPYGGDITGTWMASATMDPKAWTRSYAVTGYLKPNENRSNLTVLTGALVSRVTFEGTKGKGVIATGVEFLHDEITHTVNAKREIILCAGAIKSPQILELSGVGRPEVLTQIGVPVVVDLPGVGENVQDHALASIVMELSPTIKGDTLDAMHDPEYAANALKQHPEGKGMYRTGITSFAYFPLSTASPEQAPAIIESVAKKLALAKQSGKLPPGLAEQLDLQLETLEDTHVPDLEVVVGPGYLGGTVPIESGKKYMTMFFILQHPFSRGYIHSITKDPAAQPAINPNYFEWDIDLEQMVQEFKFVRSLNSLEPYKSGVQKEHYPGSECETDDQIREHIKNSHGTSWHTVGSCSMLPREHQGVVDPQLKVYGTSNLRIADLSIVPIQIAAHTQATAYVIGEKAGDIILGKSRV